MSTRAKSGRHLACSTCGTLQDEEYGFQKNGWPHDDTFLPAPAARLEIVKDLAPGGGRSKLLERCPACGTCYLYRTDYEFLVGGTEDEQFLTRLTDEQAAEYLAG